MLFKKKYIYKNTIYYRQLVLKGYVCETCPIVNTCDKNNLDRCSKVSSIFNEVYKLHLDESLIYNYRPC